MNFLDRISDRTAYIVAATFFGLSVLAASLAPQEAELGAWVRLVIWHGMLKWAVISLVFLMGVLAVVYLVSKRDAFFEWAHALQVALLPVWVVAVFIGAAAAKWVWGSWNLAERRMVMSVSYTLLAAVALIIGLVVDRRVLSTIMIIVTSLGMAVGLAWITYGPATADVHPASAVMSSDNPAFKILAFLMLGACLVWVLALAVPVRRWLGRHQHEPGLELGEAAEQEA